VYDAPISGTTLARPPIVQLEEHLARYHELTDCAELQVEKRIRDIEIRIVVQAKTAGAGQRTVKAARRSERLRNNCEQKRLQVVLVAKWKGRSHTSLSRLALASSAHSSRTGSTAVASTCSAKTDFRLRVSQTSCAPRFEKVMCIADEGIGRESQN
jgi:hypothetical protein